MESGSRYLCFLCLARILLLLHFPASIRLVVCTKRTLMPSAAHAGILLSVDNYYNLQLADTEEWIDGAMAGNLGEVLIRWVQINDVRATQGRQCEPHMFLPPLSFSHIRCNNVLYVRGAPEEDMEA